MLLVCSGAIAAGLPALGLARRPTDIGTLQALAAVGQPRLMERFGAILAEEQVVVGQVLLTPFDFVHRTQYLHARETLRRLLELGVIPIVNENDTVADDEIRYGDNDRIAALVANMVHAELLVLLTDTAGLFTADPRLDADASLIEEIAAVDEALEAVAGGTGSARGSGGMASKLAAAEDRLLVRHPGRDRGRGRARRGDGRAGRKARGHRGAAPRRAPAEPQALDRVRGRRRRVGSSSTTGRVGRWCRRGGRCWRQVYVRWRVSSTPTPRSKWWARTAARSRRDSCAIPRPACAAVAGIAVR